MPRFDIGRFTAYCALYLLGFVILAPLAWMVLMSISSQRDLTTVPLA